MSAPGERPDVITLLAQRWFQKRREQDWCAWSELPAGAQANWRSMARKHIEMVTEVGFTVVPVPGEQPAPSGIPELHTPVDEEAEVWADNDSTGSLHDERFPDCPGGDRCEGHTITMQVCSECGYTHDGDMALYRPWPCPTVKLLGAAPSPDEDTRRDAAAIVWTLRWAPTAPGPDTRKRAAELLAAAYLRGDEHG